MSRWGRGWEVGVRKEIDAQRRAIIQAQRILRAEHEAGKHEKTKQTACPVCFPEKEVL